MYYRMSRTRTNDEALLVHGANAVAELLRSGEPVARLQLQRGGPRTSELAAEARARGVTAEVADRSVLVRLAGTPHHQGAVAFTRPFPYRELEDLLAVGLDSALVLDGVQDPRNLGAILRTARAAGVGAVVLPRDRSVGVTPVVASASAGLVFGLPIARVANLVRGMEALRKAGLWTVGLVPHAASPLYGFAPPARIALVAGGEGDGLRSLVRRTCDFTVSLPMASGVESLNVGVAVAVALYELLVRPRS
jgi:23S rRNA (guanosine2251-2'-O)-methyltransferase